MITRGTIDSKKKKKWKDVENRNGSTEVCVASVWIMRTKVIMMQTPNKNPIPIPVLSSLCEARRISETWIPISQSNQETVG